MLFKKTLPVAVFALLTAGVIAHDQRRGDQPGSSQLMGLLENGDVDGDGNRDITDAVRLLNYLFAGGEAPTFAMCQLSGTSVYVPTEVENGDIDGSGSINLTDAILFVNWLFAGAASPVPLGCDK